MSTPHLKSLPGDLRRGEHVLMTTYTLVVDRIETKGKRVAVYGMVHPVASSRPPYRSRRTYAGSVPVRVRIFSNLDT